VKKIIIIGLLSLVANLNTFAQQGWEIGVLGGVANYFGDLNTSFNVAHPGASGTVIARYNFNNRVSIRGSAMLGQIQGNDAWSKNAFENRRNLSFRSSIMEGSLMGEFNFLPLNHGSNDAFFTPYLLTGLSVFTYNPETKYKGNWVELRSLGTEGQFINNEYGTASLALLYGGGFKIDLTDKWSLNLEIAGRKVFTDYLDDVSGNFPDLRDVRRLRGNVAADLVDRSGEPRIGTAGRQRGNGKSNDAYATLSIGILYYFGDLKCPSFYR
jgi:opacity protein-like surface antigen